MKYVGICNTSKTHRSDRKPPRHEFDMMTIGEPAESMQDRLLEWICSTGLFGIISVPLDQGKANQ